MNAAKEVYERDRQKVFGRGEGQPDVINKRKKLQLYQSESHKMKSLFLYSASLRSGAGSIERPNPLWQSFPERCTKPIRSVEEMKQKLEYFSKSDDVMVVRYHQNNCTACNALDKTFESICHENSERYPNLHFYDISKDEVPELAKGLVRFPQVKGYSGGQWQDLEFKPHAEFRESLYQDVEHEVRRKTRLGEPVTALQAEEMYFSAAGPAMLIVLEESITKFYCQAQVRMHNYWKQVSVRRSWFFKKFIEPRVEAHIKESFSPRSVFGEQIKYGPDPQELV